MSSFDGLGLTGCPGSVTGVKLSSSASIFLPLHGRQLVLAHLRSLAHGLLEQRMSSMVCPQHLSTNLTAGDPRTSPNVSSTSWSVFLSVESLV